MDKNIVYLLLLKTIELQQILKNLTLMDLLEYLNSVVSSSYKESDLIKTIAKIKISDVTNFLFEKCLI